MTKINGIDQEERLFNELVKLENLKVQGHDIYNLVSHIETGIALNFGINWLYGLASELKNGHKNMICALAGV